MMPFLENCSFCVDSSDSKNEVVRRTIVETENFRVFPTLGQIVEGYLLIAPKEHYPCIGAMPDEQIEEFINLKENVGRKLQATYGPSIFFEHGVIGQTVLHAHMHAIPFPNEKDLFDTYFKTFPRYKKLDSLQELKDIWNKEGVYLFYEINAHKFAFFTHIVPQYARITVANAFGAPERANWRTMPRELDDILIRNAIEKLK